MQRPSRPVGITILAALEILIGVVGLLASLVIIGFSALFSTLPRVGSLLGAVGLVIGGVVLFFSIIWLATGVGFLHGRGLVLDSRDDFQHTLTARGDWRSDNRSNHRWGRWIDFLESDAVLSDENSCESLLRKKRITNYACLHDAIFTGTSRKSAPNRDKCRLQSTVGGRSPGHFSAHLTRSISK